MKKSVIALAVASAMPFAVQADTTITGNVSAKYILSTTDANLVDKGMDIDSDLDISSTEVLANGMTATASFDVSSQAGGSTGTASLAGDFGTLTVGSGLDADGAFQAGDVADVVGDTTTGDTDESGSEANAIHYSGSFSGLNLAVQLNAATTAGFEASDNNADDAGSATNVSGNTQTESSQVGLSYEIMDGLTVGYSTASDALGDASGAFPDDGVMAETSAFGVAYTAGAISVKAGKQEDDDAKVSVGYTADNWSVTYNHDSGDDNEDDVDFTYDMGNGLSFVMEYDKGETAGNNQEINLDVTYATGDLSITVTQEHNKSNDVSISYDMGNADLGLAIDDSNSETAVTYKVSF